LTVLKPDGAKNLMNTKRRRDRHIVTRHFSLSSLEAGNPGHAQTPSPITDAEIGKVFHG
jgi:hypothetical protein